MSDFRPISINTIGACIEHGQRISLHCDESGLTPCNFWKWLDLEKLAEKHGPDQGILHKDLVPHLWCLKCGSRNVSICIHPKSWAPGDKVS